MTQYRSRPRIVEAFQWQPDIVTMEEKHPFPEWLDGRVTPNGTILEVWTVVGMLRAHSGDWVVKTGPNYSVLDSKQFLARYEAVA